MICMISSTVSLRQPRRVTSGVGGRVIVNAGESTTATGGSMSFTSGHGSSSSSGAFTVLQRNAKPNVVRFPVEKRNHHGSSPDKN